DLVLFDIANDARGDLPDPDLRAVDGRAESRPADARGARHALLAADRFVLELDRIRVVQLTGPHESNPKPRASSVRSSRLRRPSRWSARSSDQRVAWMPRDAAGSGGNGSGLRRTISSSVRSVRSPASRSSIVSA